MTGTMTERRRVGDDGEWVVTPVYLIDGREVTGEEFLAAFPPNDDVRVRLGGAISGTRPWVSEALAVHPSQIPAAVARNKRHGLSIAYDGEGRPVCTDAGQRRALMRIEGVRQKNSYYGH